MTNIRPKVAAATAGGGLAAIIIAIFHRFLGIELPPDIAAAIATILAFVFGWSKPEK